MTLYIARFLVDFLICVENPKDPTIHVKNTVDFLSPLTSCDLESNLCIARLLVDFLDGSQKPKILPTHVQNSVDFPNSLMYCYLGRT